MNKTKRWIFDELIPLLIELIPLLIATVILFGFVFAFTFYEGTPATAAPPNQYTSPWTLVAPGEYVDFTHGLGTRPLIVHAWVALKIDRGEAVAGPQFGEATPIWQYNLRIITVNGQRIVVYNASDVAEYVQVRAEP